MSYTMQDYLYLNSELCPYGIKLFHVKYLLTHIRHPHKKETWFFNLVQRFTLTSPHVHQSQSF